MDIESTNSLIKRIEFYERMEKPDEVQYIKRDLGEAIAEKLSSLNTTEMITNSIPFDDFKDNLTVNKVYRRCDTCRLRIVNKGDHRNCYGHELGCNGVEDNNNNYGES